VMVIWITVWSEPEGGKLFYQDRIKRSRCVLANKKSMTLDLWEFAFATRVYEREVFRRECSLSSAARK
jgi:hypothetical protein